MTASPAARPAPLFADIDDVKAKLTETGYLPDTATATAVFLADRLGKPLLVEGGDRLHLGSGLFARIALIQHHL